MTYLDELLTSEEDVKREVEYIPLAADDDTKEPDLNEGDVLGVLPLRNMVLFPIRWHRPWPREQEVR